MFNEKVEFKVETGISIPSRARNNQLRGSKYPFHNMEYTDSFYFPCKKDEQSLMKKRVHASYYAWKKESKKPGRMISRSDDNGIRFWRVEF